MFRNYLITTWRYLIRDKTYLITNLAGLSLGMTCFILIYLFIQDELSFDDFHVNKHRIHRIVKNNNAALVGPPFASALANDYPELEAVIRFTRANGSDISIQHKRFTNTSVYFADPAILEVFTFEILQGSAAHALTDLNSVVLTEVASRKYFGEQDPIGKIMLYQNQFPLKVTAIIKDVSGRTHLPFDILISHTLQDQIWGEDILTGFDPWFWSTTACYVSLKQGVNPEAFEENLQGFLARHVDDNRARLTKLGLQCLDDAYLYSSNITGFHKSSDIKYIYIFSGLAILILLIAAINFINLATAKSISRAEEVGIRKSMGAFRHQLTAQFIVEAYLIVIIALVFAVFLVELALPKYADLVGRPIAFSLSDHATLLGTLAFVVGLLSGSYPAFILSAFNPIKAMKGKIKHDVAGVNIRKVLVISQFLIGILVVIFAIVIYQQMEFINNKKLGLRKDQVLVIDFPQISPEKYNAFKTELLGHSNIAGIGGSWIPPFHLVGIMGPVKAEVDQQMTEVLPNPYFLWVDKDFIPTYEIKLIAGENFHREYSKDDIEFILNETAVRQTGWKSPEEAIGKEFQYTNSRTGHIVGVVEDFHFEQLRNIIKPLVLFEEPDRINVMAVKFGPGNIGNTTEFIKNKLKSHFPDQLFPIFFLDDDFQALYRSVSRMQYLFGIFALLGIFTGCLGLFALASYTVAQRTKEIGIRKVLGASVFELTTELNSRFSLLVTFAFIVACPIAYILISEWLQEFAYHVTLTPWPFLLAGLIAFVTALLTVSFQTLKAALANPAEAIRSE